MKTQEGSKLGIAGEGEITSFDNVTDQASKNTKFESSTRKEFPQSLIGKVKI